MPEPVILLWIPGLECGGKIRESSSSADAQQAVTTLCSAL